MDLIKLNVLVENEMERLTGLDITDDKLGREIERGNAVAQLSKSYIRSVSLALQVEKFKAENLKSENDLPEVLRMGK